MSETTPPTPENGDTSQQWLADFSSISKDDMVRGGTPADIEARCLSLVQSYIGGSWANATSPADITVRRISGGFTNQLYHVQLKESVPKAENPIYQEEEEPTEVAIKLYQSKHIKNYHPDDPERLNDTVVLNVMSQTGLGPKVYGIFADGFIQAYHQHEQFRGRHMEQPALRRQLMTLLANIAHLQVPIRKEPDLILQWCRDFISYGYEHFDVLALAKELKLKYLSTVDVLVEFDALVVRIKALKSPLVFAHNDFRGSNLLVTQGKDKTEIFACDLEHAGYGSRGYDLATIFWEWGQKEVLDMTAPPPTDENLTDLLTTYIECCDEVSPGYSSRPENSLEAHAREVKLNNLFNVLFFAGFLIGQKEVLIATMPIDRKKNLDEPTEVAIKLYQSKHMKTYHADDPERLNDTVVLNVMSQTGLGPKVYGIFADGFIQAYHRHEQLRARHQADPALRRQLMLLLAKIAHLQVPIRKTANVVLETAGEYVAYGYEHFQVQALAEELNLAHLKVTDIRAEHRELMNKIRQLNGPLVFSHYDFRGNNLMVVTNEKENEKSQKILSVDLEFACYGTRGYDLACIFLESGQTEFLDMASPPPTDETLQEYVRLYIDACEEVVPGYSKLEINSFEQHLKEARLMVLANKLFLVAFLIGQREALIATVPLDRKKNLAFAEAVLADYLQNKESYIEKGFY